MLPQPNCTHNLEAVEFRHMEVQEQEVESPFDRQVQCLSAVGCHPHGVPLPGKQSLQMS